MIYILKSNDDRVSNEAELMQNVCVLNLLQIESLAFSIDSRTIQSFDYILFTSKNAIKAIRNHEHFQEFIKKPAIVIGEKTKQAWIHVGGSVLFCPQTHCDGKSLAFLMQQNLGDSIKDKQILYLCGQDKATNLAEILKDSYNITELVVYRSLENESVIQSFLQQQMQDKQADSIQNEQNCVFADESIFIFGSPKHYKTFMKYYTWNPTWLAISLGDTTFQSFGENVRKLNAKGNFEKALKVAHAMCDDTPMQDKHVILEK